MLSFRRATEKDARDIFHWRNDPQSRENSLNKEIIVFEDHLQWFTRKLSDPKCWIFILLSDDVSVGQLRFDFDSESSALVSISISPEKRSQGFAGEGLTKMCAFVFQNAPIKKIRAQIKKGNEASIRLFEKAGFQTISELNIQGADCLVLELSSPADSRPETAYTCWVDDLGIFSLLWIFLLGRERKITCIKYLTITAMGKVLISLFRVNIKFRLELADYKKMSGLVNEKAVPFWKKYSDAEDASFAVVAEGYFQDSLVDWLSQKYDLGKKAVRIYLQQVIYHEVRGLTTLAKTLEWTQRQKMPGTLGNIILTRNYAWAKYVQRSFYKKVELSFYPNVKSWFTLFFHLIRIVVAFFVNLAGSFWKMIVGKRKKQSSQSKVAVLYVQGVDLNGKSDFFWYPDSGLKPEEMLVYARVPYRPITSEIDALLRSYHIDWIDLIPKRFSKKFLGLGSPELYVYASWSYVKSLGGICIEVLKLSVGAIFSGLKSTRIWELQHLAGLLYHICFYEAVFTDQKVKVHLSLLDGEQLTASNLGASLAGAVNISHNWSNYPELWVGHGKPFDAYFAWGPAYRRLFERDYYSIDHLLYLGYPHDHAFKKTDARLQDIQKDLRSKGVNFIICFFDEVYNPHDCFVKKEFEDIYHALLKELEADPTLGMVIKPKRKNYYSKELADIKDLIEKAERTGRCVFLDEKILPSAAAKISDLVVGFYIFNTAALEAALAGIPTVTVNYGRMDFHSLYKQGRGTVVFDDAASLMSEIRKFRDHSKDTQGFADYSPFLDQIDPYRDGKSYRRLGQYVKTVFDELNNGKSKKEAMKNANERYRRDFGSENVIDLFHSN